MTLSRNMEVFSDNIYFQQNVLDGYNHSKRISSLISDYNNKENISKRMFFTKLSKQYFQYRKIIYLIKESLKNRDYATALKLLEDNYRQLDRAKSEKLLNLFSGRKARLLLLADIFNTPLKTEKEKTGKALYFLFNSYPYADNGYAIRSQGIAKSLIRQGVNVEIITRAGYPFDVKRNFKVEDLAEYSQDGVIYSRVLWPKRYQSNHKDVSYKTEEYLWLSVVSYMGVLKSKNPKVVIAASNYITSLPIYLASKLLGIPFIYDIRGFWELTESSRNNNYKNSEFYQIDSFIETELVRRSKYVFAISSTLKDRLDNEIYQRTKISNITNLTNIQLLLNGSDVKPEISFRVNQRSLILGFFGAINDYEGLDDLLISMSSLIEEGYEISLKIIGGGGAKSFQNSKSYHQQLLELVDNLNLEQHVKFIDKVKIESLPQFYKNVDLVVIPRKNWEVCNLITPLKLVEAMSFGKAILASDVDAISENIIDRENGYLFKRGSQKALKQKIKEIYLDRDLLLNVSKQAHDWFLENRTWDIVVQDLVKTINHIDDSRIESVFDDSTLLEEMTVYKNYISQYQKKNKKNKLENFDNTSLKVVFILHSSLPYLSGGYATRAHGLIKGIKNSGVDVYPYTRPGFPNDLKRKNLSAQFPLIDNVDGIDYRRIFSNINRLEYDERVFMWNSIESYIELFKETKPSLVHGRSTYLISLPAYIAALSLGIPFIYEVSGLWELVFESRDDAAENAQKIQRIRGLETLIMKGADQILTLTVDMKDEIVSRGVDEDKITLIPNSVDINKFVKVDKKPELLHKLGITPKDFIFGYIGSFVEYEGLDDLIHAFDKVASDIPHAKLILVGSGNVKDKIVDIAAKSRYAKRIMILDRIPHEEVLNYYSLLDVVVFARKGWDVCEKVSPMKPFEAMACEKVVLSSSVKALSDIVNDNVTGFVFEKDSIDDLALHLKKLYSKKQDLEGMGKIAREWVVKNRSWDKAGLNVAKIYQQVMEYKK